MKQKAITLLWLARWTFNMLFHTFIGLSIIAGGFYGIGLLIYHAIKDMHLCH